VNKKGEHQLRFVWVRRLSILFIGLHGMAHIKEGMLSKAFETSPLTNNNYTTT